MTDLLSLLYEAAGDFDELEDPRRVKKAKMTTKNSSLPLSTSQSHPNSDNLSRPRSTSSNPYSSSPFSRSAQQASLVFGFEERDQSTNGGSPPSPSGSMESSSVTSAMEEMVGMDDFASSETDDDDSGMGMSGSHSRSYSQQSGHHLSHLGGMQVVLNSASSSAPSASDPASLSHLLNSKKRKRVTKQSSRRAKPLTVEILFQIFENLNIQKEPFNGTYKLVLPSLKSAECSSIYFAVTEWQCFRKRIMNHGFEIVDELQSSWIRVRPNLSSPDGRLIFEDLELRRRYGTPCKIKNARERSEIFEIPPLDPSDISRLSSSSHLSLDPSFNLETPSNPSESSDEEGKGPLNLLPLQNQISSLQSPLPHQNSLHSHPSLHSQLSLSHIHPNIHSLNIDNMKLPHLHPSSSDIDDNHMSYERMLPAAVENDEEMDTTHGNHSNGDSFLSPSHGHPSSSHLHSLLHHHSSSHSHHSHHHSSHSSHSSLQNHSSSPYHSPSSSILMGDHHIMEEADGHHSSASALEGLALKATKGSFSSPAVSSAQVPSKASYASSVFCLN